MNPYKVALLLFGSGLCALIYQTTWLREFRLIFGASTPASAAVLAIFMGGLGLGSAVLGRRSERQASPLWFYGRLELFIGLSAAVTPLLLWLARAVYVGVGGTQQLGAAPGAIARLVLSALVLGVPTFLMGGTLPAAARAVEVDEDAGRRRLALLYGMNTLGAVTGALLSTFFLLEHLGNRLTLWAACGLNVLVAVLACGMARAKRGVPAAPVAPPPPVESAPGLPELGSRSVCAAAAAVGFAFFLMEIVWFRMLSPLLGGTAFTFGLILAVALLGIGLGGIGYALLGQQRPASRQAFAFTCLLEALCLGVPLALGDRVAVLAVLLRPLGVFSFMGHVAGWTVIASIVVLPAALVAGFQFPLLIGLLGRGTRDVGRHTGQAYAWNTAGAIGGSLAGGFGLLPLLTAPGVWRLVIGLLVALGVVALGRTAGAGGRPSVLRWLGALGMGAAAVATLFSTGPTAAWRHAPIGAGRVEVKELVTRNKVIDYVHSYQRNIHWEAEGREVSVALDRESGFSFIVNGRSDGSARGDASTQVMSGLLAALVHPRPERVFVVGLGTGSTAGWLGKVPSIQQVEVAELEPSILKVAEYCAPVNAGVMTNPKVRIIVGDGREVLLTTPYGYDIIISEPSNLYRAGVASLFTRDFYRAVRWKLNEGGIFAQWVQAYDTDMESIRTAIATLSSVFPHVELWCTVDVDLIFLASNKPIVHDVTTLRQRIREAPFQTAMEKTWRAQDLEGVLARYVANAEFCRRVAGTASRLNTDDRMVLEFSYGRGVGSGRNGDHPGVLRAAALDLGFNRPTLTNGEVNWSSVLRQRVSSMVADDEAPAVPQIGDHAINRAQAMAHYVNDELETAWGFWKLVPGEPRDLIELMVAAELTADVADPKALPLIERLRAHEPTEADALLGLYYFRTNDVERASRALAAAFIGYRTDPWPYPPLMRRAINTARAVALQEGSAAAERIYAALESPFAVYLGNSTRLRARQRIAAKLDAQRLLIALEAFEPHIPWEEDFLKLRADCYQQLNHPKAAAARGDLAAFQANEPPPLFNPTTEPDPPADAGGK